MKSESDFSLAIASQPLKPFSSCPICFEENPTRKKFTKIVFISYLSYLFGGFKGKTYEHTLNGDYCFITNIRGDDSRRGGQLLRDLDTKAFLH